MPVFLYNTLSRQKEEFKSIIPNQVGLYTCGPTVYHYAHLGNLRAFIFEDVLKQALKYNGYSVRHIMNITDVGHLVGDGDLGEDKLEKGAKRTGKTAWEVADFYTEAFLNDLKLLNIENPDVMPKATEYINEQIELIKILETKGFTYKISDGIYYDTSKFEGYNKLSHKDLETLKEGARVEKNEEKKNPTDFALWKFSPINQKRDMEWDSPWGVGFPGWHIECSAMSMKLLGEQLDIHCGGIDHIDVHHSNEIAQSEAATDKQFFNYWMHGAFLNIAGGKKMAKSDDNFLTLENAFTKKGINPLVYRFAVLTTHYRKPMEYSEEGMLNAEKGYRHLLNQVRQLREAMLVEDFEDVSVVDPVYLDKFLGALNDDLNTSQVLALLQDLLKSGLAPNIKMDTLLDFDKVLRLNLDKEKIEDEIPQEVAEIVEKREKARLEKDWGLSDQLRDEILALGFLVEDGKDGMRVYQK